MNIALKRNKIDRVYLALFLVLVGLGLVIQYSASSSMAAHKFGSTIVYVRGQLMRIVLGAIIATPLLFINYQRLKKWALVLVLVSIVLLIYTLIYNRFVSHAKTARWFPIGSFHFQPSELAKIAVIFYCASFMERHQRQLDDFKRGFMPVAAILFLLVGLIAIEPDFSTSAVIASFGLVVMIVGGTRIRHLIPLFVSMCIGAVYIVLHSPYKLRRVLTFLNPNHDLQGSGYQIHQSLISLGNGGLWGKGLGASIEKNLFLPFPHTDFIFSVIGEEVGFIGGVALLAIFLGLFVRGIRIALRAPDIFGMLLCTGLSVSLFAYVLVNVGVTCGILPVTGLPLPFISYGGSAMIFNFVSVALILNVSRYVIPKTKPVVLVTIND
jgi:cell division protein FtsW